MPSRKPSEQLRVDQAQKRLADALDEACAGNPADADTGELIKLEEVLAIANDAAKEAISLRRRLRYDEARTHRMSPEHGSTVVHRVFDDKRGVRWNAFAVYPSHTTKGKSTLPDLYRGGWLSFNSLEETRRIAPIPPDWIRLSDDALCRLCEQADVARRTGSREGPSTP